MGYCFLSNSTKKDVVNHLLNGRNSENAKVLEGVVCGNYLWMLIEFNGKKSIEVAILTKDGNDYGYKVIGEGSGPYHYGCPAKLVAKADEPENEYAVQWRENNVKALAHQARVDARKVGDVIVYGGRRYKLEVACARGSFIVSRSEDGVYFKMSAAKFKDAEFL